MGSGPWALLPLLVLLGVAGGALELHPAGAEHRLPSDPGSTVFACEDGHGAATHVEAPRTVERESCAACLHRLQNQGRFDAVAAHRDRAPARQVSQLPLPRRATGPVLDRAPSRGPPAA